MQNKQALLVVCDEGIVVELGVPDVDKLDTARTFEIKDVTVRQYTFHSIKSRLRVCFYVLYRCVTTGFHSVCCTHTHSHTGNVKNYCKPVSRFYFKHIYINARAKVIMRITQNQ